MRVSLEFPEPPLFTYTTAVRITDLSTGLHLGFDKLVSILHDAAAGFLSELGIHIDRPEGPKIIFADLAVQFLGEAFWHDSLQIHISASGDGSKGLALYFRVAGRGQAQPVALAKIGAVFFDYTARKAMPMPAAAAERLAQMNQSANERNQYA